MHFASFVHEYQTILASSAALGAAIIAYISTQNAARQQASGAIGVARLGRAIQLKQEEEKRERTALAISLRISNDLVRLKGKFSFRATVIALMRENLGKNIQNFSLSDERHQALWRKVFFDSPDETDFVLFSIPTLEMSSLPPDIQARLHYLFTVIQAYSSLVQMADFAAPIAERDNLQEHEWASIEKNITRCVSEIKEAQDYLDPQTQELVRKSAASRRELEVMEQSELRQAALGATRHRNHRAS